jgi:hypothetical protein
MVRWKKIKCMYCGDIVEIPRRKRLAICFKHKCATQAHLDYRRRQAERTYNDRRR